MAITDDVVNELRKDYPKPEDLLGEDGPFKQLQERSLEKAMAAELTDHLGYAKGFAASTSRCGSTLRAATGLGAPDNPRPTRGWQRVERGGSSPC
ncbi:MAG: hypothetical protein V9H26_06995 [Verrucomicrobiota bacterium]|jgi:putative transposase